jgi:putative tryptophan/tyrosine transport system substrate-binding protein
MGVSPRSGGECIKMRRREFITLFGGGLAAWPFGSARAQTPPVIGYLSGGSREPSPQLLSAFHQGLADIGYAEGRNVAIEYRWAEGQYDRLPALAADLVRRKVALIVATGGTMSAQAAKAETKTIPILLVSGFDPVQLVTVAGFKRDGGNTTGVALYATPLTVKRLEFLRELVPGASKIALLVNPDGLMAETEVKDIKTATRAAGLQLLVLKTSADADITAAFASAAQHGIDALVVSSDAFFTRRRTQIVALAAQRGIRVVYPWREYVEAGGLLSYGPRLGEAFREIGRYAGRILKGATVAELPIQAPRKFELIINLKTAKALELTVPPLLLARADEVIE